MKSFGTDPEFMLLKDGKYHSAIGVVNGSITDRIKISGHEFYYDNVLAECAVQPGHSKKEFIENLRECLQIYSKMVEPFQLSTCAATFYPEEELEHPDAKKVGCAPDMCAYEMELIDPPEQSIQNTSLRSCGGHIHLGDKILQSEGPEPVFAVYMLDLFLGIPSVWLDEGDSSCLRRSVYGQAGRYRDKDYGLEYRSLGNFWLKSPELAELIYDLSDFALQFVKNGNVDEHWKFDEEVFFDTMDLSKAFTCTTYDPQIVRDGIDKADKEALSDLYKWTKGFLPSKLKDDLEAAEGLEQNRLNDNWQIK